MRTLAALAVLMLVAACQGPPAEMTEAEVAQIEAEVVAAVEALMDGWETLDADQALAAFHPDVSWSGSSVPRQPPEMGERWTNNFASMESMDLDLRPVAVRVLTEDAAFFQGTYECTITRADGTIQHWPHNATLNLFLEQRGGEWKIALGGQTVGTAEVTPPDQG